MNQTLNQEQQGNSFDPKFYLFKVLSYWKLFVTAIIIALVVAKFLNGYQERKYSLSTIFTVKEETNPLFSTGTSLTFNWGGSSDLLQTIKIILGSRTHNEKVVSKLQYYVDYLKEGKYRDVDVYGNTPFIISVDTSSFQIINKRIKLEILSRDSVKLSFEVNESGTEKLMRYSDYSIQNYSSSSKMFSKEYNINEPIISSYFSFSLNKLQDLPLNEVYYLRFNKFYSTVGKYRNVRVSTVTKGSSVMQLQLQGVNKNRIVDYLNTSIKVLAFDKQMQKTLYAQKTKAYIDTLFAREARALKTNQEKLGRFKESNKIYDLSLEGQEVYNKTKELTNELRMLEESLDYLSTLERYLRSNTSYDHNIPVPALVKVEDSKIPATISELIVKSKLKAEIERSVKPNHPQFKRLIKDIDLLRDMLIENITNLRSAYNKSQVNVKKRLDKFNSQLRELPVKQQELIKFERNYAYSEANYSYLKQKSYEAGTAIEASVSDVKVIDSAIDLGEGPIYPKPTFNYLVAIMLGIIFPLFYIIIKELLDNKIYSVEDLMNRYKIPVLGVVGRNLGPNNLAVFERPKSSVSESFRALRSNIQFLLKKSKENGKKSKTIVFTSSVSGEGKTMVSLNMATVFALSGKKTVLIGLDLRKPKIYDDFGVKNHLGVVNYLIGQKSKEEIIFNSEIPNLDIILSGPIPPNPSELIVSDECDNLIKELQEVYDYVIIDTPPVGLVSDALELFKYSDAICYIVRQGYTQKGMMKMIDDKYVNKEVSNISYILNDFSLKGKYYGYGYSYGYGYGYGYGNYNNGYHENEDKPKSLITKIIDVFRPKR